ncbi:MAG: STAS domain-containing protein [Candidatus Omnitrophica bacterium]|nr:STAS domain-containing protein [Candidatus Omnitrophota bacterium]MBU1128188.1 STAS domain-containing protein [Candidatus Omnitrophota bacterium]MBU1785188.1 STAS domain-containing protein [Candidatus Omnitrophota bacterium]MBU1852069.1 STAS domain-containing protein [Candidatus Omnitrophota bacterium]
MSFKVDVEEQGEGVYTIVIEGRLDAETYQSFDEKIKPLLNAATKVLVFDMGKLEYISSIGMGVIFKARKIVEMNKGKIVMAKLQPQIEKVFALVKLLPRDGIFESMEEVDKYLDAVQKREIEKKKDPPRK